MNSLARIASLVSVAFLLSLGCATAPTQSPVLHEAESAPVATLPEPSSPLADESSQAKAIRNRLVISEPSTAQARELTEILPGHPYPWILLGLLALEENDLETSTSAFFRALKLEPDHETALLGLGEIAGRKGDQTGMVSYYEKAWKTSGSSDSANRLAYVRINNRQPDLARNILQESVVNHPEDVTARNNLAVVLDLSGISSEALDLLENSAPDTPGIYETRAMIQLKEGHPDLAGTDIEAAFAEGSEGSSSLLLLGILNLQRGQLSAAEESLRSFIDEYPGYYEGYLNLGLTLRRQGRFSEAEAVYKEGARVTGKPDLYLNLGVLYELYLGKPDHALDNYSKFVELKGAESTRIQGWIGYLSGLPAVKSMEDPSP